MGLQYIRLAPGFVREALEAYEQWRVEKIPMKIHEFLMILEIEVNRRYYPGSWPEHRRKLPESAQQRLSRVSLFLETARVFIPS